MAVIGGNADSLARPDLQARGKAVLASVRRGPGADRCEARLGHLTLAAIATGVQSAAPTGVGAWSGAAPQLQKRKSQPISPPGMWCHDVAGIANVNIDFFTAHGSAGAWLAGDELPMKVDVSSLSCARHTVAPPPGL